MSKIALSTALAALASLVAIGCDDGHNHAGEAPDMNQSNVANVVMSLVATAQLSGIVFDPAQLTVPADASALAEQVQVHAMTAVKCGTVTRADKTVTIDFGAGCKPDNSPLTLVGKAVAKASVPSGMAVLDFELTGFGTTSRVATGTASIMGMAGTGLWDVTIDTAMASGNAAVNGGIIAQVGKINVKSVAYEGLTFKTKPGTTVVAEDAKAPVDVIATDFVQELKACYPTLGTFEFAASGVKARLEFSPTLDTKTTGKALFFPPLSKKGEEIQLPGLGWKCN